MIARGMRRFWLAVGLTLSAGASAPAGAQDLENTLYLDLEWGRVTIELLPDLAPNHVERIKTLTRRGFYNGVVFHRVIDGFMVQGGDPTGTGRGGSDLPDLRAEFSAEPHVRGVLSMARARSPHSANSQFFIMLDRVPSLDRQYTVWGRVIDGMDHVDRIKKGDRVNDGIVDDPDRIVRMQVAADAR